MATKINCKYNDRGVWCTDKRIKRSLLGIGTRCCILFPGLNGKKCEYQVKYERPILRPPSASPEKKGNL
jgi:hypothetical protein